MFAAMQNRIREIREAKGLSQPQLAEKVGTSQPQMDRLEKGQRRLTQEWMQRIAKALKCEPGDLIAVTAGAAPARPLSGLDPRQKRILLAGVKEGLRQIGVDPDSPEGMRQALAAFDKAEAHVLADLEKAAG
jgi:transcriptional regulator with XRE-family HTH domain